MELEQLFHHNGERWDRNILNSYWLVLTVTVLVRTEVFDGHPGSSPLFARDILIPALALGLVVVLTELVMYSIAPKYRPYTLLLSAEAMAVVLTVLNSHSPFVSVLLLFPILISLFYFELDKLYLTAAMSLILLILLLLFDMPLRASLTPITVITSVGALLATFYLSMHLTRRSVEVMRHLKSTVESNQQLLIQSVMMESASKLDGLTNTYNHKSFHEHMGSLLEQHRQTSDFQIHLLVIDIDDFKQVNDSYGHQTGDIILRRVAQTIHQHCLPNDFLARYGGEEFALTMVGRSLQEAVESGQSMCQAVGALYHPEARGRSITISLGLAEHHQGQTKDALFKAADTALYRAKHQGKNQLVLAPDSSEETVF